jgi:Flp pilus assembly pilin Flp
MTHAGSENGQTVVEYTMLAGLMTMIAIVILGMIDVPIRQLLQRITLHVIGQLLDPSF